MRLIILLLLFLFFAFSKNICPNFMILFYNLTGENKVSRVLLLDKTAMIFQRRHSNLYSKCHKVVAVNKLYRSNISKIDDLFYYRLLFDVNVNIKRKEYTYLSLRTCFHILK
jgi:hypothetical protein